MFVFFITTVIVLTFGVIIFPGIYADKRYFEHKWDMEEDIDKEDI